MRYRRSNLRSGCQLIASRVRKKPIVWQLKTAKRHPVEPFSSWQLLALLSKRGVQETYLHTLINLTNELHIKRPSQTKCTRTPLAHQKNYVTLKRQYSYLDACRDDQPSPYSAHQRTSSQTDPHPAIAHSVHNMLKPSILARLRPSPASQVVPHPRTKPGHPHCPPSKDILDNWITLYLNRRLRYHYSTFQLNKQLKNRNLYHVSQIA